LNVWPCTFEDVRAAADRIWAFLPWTPLRSYALLDQAVGAGIRIWVKHENHQPTGAFKVRNGLAALTYMTEAVRRRGVIAASKGNHGLGLAWSGARLGVPVTVCVPRGNNPEKNEAIRGEGARLIEEGSDYDEAVTVAERMAAQEGLRLVHSTNDIQVIAGAGTLALEILEERPGLQALVFALGGGSQAVGAMIAARGLRRDIDIYAVQAAGAAAIHDAWRAGRPVSYPSARTFADGIATHETYPLTFKALRQGLKGFVTVSDTQIAEALRLLLRTTHNLVEGAGAAGLAGLLRLRDELAGKEVGIVLSGGNIDQETLRRVLTDSVSDM
jgi:threonine dehydratase